MFRSFWQAGFDCTVGRNRHRGAIDHVAASGHGVQVCADYRRLVDHGIRTVRDGVPWPLVEQGGRYRWDAFDRMVDAAHREGVQVIHDLCHFGYPEHLDIYAEEFVDAFAAFAYEVALRLKGAGDEVFVTPINEPSYFAWAAAHAARFPPYSVNRASDLKRQLVRAIIAGTDAFWTVLPSATIITVDPICVAVAPRASPELVAVAHAFNEGAVLESWDMIAGRSLPELGGSPRHLGIVGANYYANNQWEWGSEDVALAPDDPRRTALSDLLAMLWKRYGAEIVVSETGHGDAMRAPWVRFVAAEVVRCRELGVPLRGVCLYPILGMPDWDAPERWLRMGLWDVAADGERVLHAPMLEALAAAGCRNEAADGRSIMEGTPMAAVNSPAPNIEEYKTLRDETLKRIDARNQIFSYTLVFAASMFTLGSPTTTSPRCWSIRSWRSSSRRCSPTTACC